MEENKSTAKAVKTTAGDVGVKFLDILSKPINILCDYVEEPIKIIESMRKINEEDDGKRTINNELRKEKELNKLHQKNLKAQQEYEKAQVKMKKEMAEAEAEIEAFKRDAERKNQSDLLNSIKDYQNELSKSYVSMTKAVLDSTTTQTVETMKLLTELTKQITEIQKEEEIEIKRQIKELKDDFGDDRKTFNMLRDDLLNDKAVVIDHVKDVLCICREQIDRINRLSDEYAKNGGQTIRELLLPITGAQTYNMLSNSSAGELETSDKAANVIETDAVEVE